MPLEGRQVLVPQHAVDAVADARVFRPDAGVEHPDDDSFAGAAGVGGVRAELRPAELSPELARPVDVEEVGRVGRGRRPLHHGLDGHDVGHTLERLGLSFGELGRKAVVDVAVVVDLLAPADLREDGVMARVEMVDVVGDLRALRVDLLALGRLRSRDSGDAARVLDDRRRGELDDICTRHALGLGARDLEALDLERRRRSCGSCYRDGYRHDSKGCEQHAKAHCAWKPHWHVCFSPFMVRALTASALT